MQITEKLRGKILLSLPKGYARLIAEKCDVSEMTVYRVLHHGQENESVAEALIRLAHDTKESTKQKHKDLNRLAAQL